MSPEEEVVRGAQAAQVLDAPIFVEAKKAVLDGIQRQMKAVPIHDQAMHTRLIMLLQVWTTLESYLDLTKQSGQVAQFQIQQVDDRKKLFKMFG